MDITSFFISKRNDSLLSGDYGSYRKALSRRILTLRRKLGRTSPRGRKYTAKTPITANDVSSDPEFVHLQILTAERAWAHAMYMKSMHSAESDKAITGSTRAHVLSRLEKAKKTVVKLVDLLRDPEALAPKSALLEARAYYYLMDGALQLEARKWTRCLEAYSVIHVVYSVLAQKSNPKNSEIFKETISSTIEPSIRYAAYQLSVPRTMAVPNIVHKHISKSSEAIKAVLELDPNALKDRKAVTKVQKGKSGRDLPSAITWRSRTVNIEDARIAQSLASAYEAEEKLADLLFAEPDMAPPDKATAYDDVLNPSQDAVDSTKTAIDELSAEGVSSADPRLQALQVTRTALNYALIGWRVGRNRVLCGREDGAHVELAQRKHRKKSPKLSKRVAAHQESNAAKLARLRERLVLYDSTLQSIDSIKELPGVAADQSLVEELDSKKSYFSALRSLTLARSHVLLDNPKNALALFARSLSIVSTIGTADPPPPQSRPLSLEVTQSQTNSLQHLLQGLVTQHQALVELHNLHDEAVRAERGKKAGLTPFIEHLDQYPLGGVDLTQLVDYPPRLRPVPVKPIFLDVAWNYIDYPGREKAEVMEDKDGPINVQTQDEKKETKRGWGWFGR